jgi:hypothetical protein
MWVHIWPIYIAIYINCQNWLTGVFLKCMQLPRFCLANVRSFRYKAHDLAAVCQVSEVHIGCVVKWESRPQIATSQLEQSIHWWLHLLQVWSLSWMQSWRRRVTCWCWMAAYETAGSWNSWTWDELASSQTNDDAAQTVSLSYSCDLSPFQFCWWIDSNFGKTYRRLPNSV